MANVTTCSMCEKAYEEVSEEAANRTFRLCPSCYHGWDVEFLPPCRLCGERPAECKPSLYVRCSNKRCRLSHLDMTPPQWHKLHCDPTQRPQQQPQPIECRYCFWWDWDHGAWGYEGNGGLCRYDRDIRRKTAGERCHNFARVP